jgi:Xaa-Pro aminopeptidase
MELLGLDAILAYGNPDTFHGPGDVRYATDYSCTMGEWMYLLSRNGESVLLLDEVLFWDLPGARERCAEVDQFQVSSNYGKTLAKLIGDKRSSIGLENSHLLPNRIYSELARSLPSADIKTTNILHALRKVKSQSEILALEEVEKITQDAMGAIFDSAASGKTELQVAIPGISVLKSYNDEFAFPGPEVVSGTRTASQAGQATERKLTIGDLLLVDLGAKKYGYCGDLTRMAIVGKATKDQIDLFDALIQMYDRGLKEIRPGTKVSKVYESAQEAIAGKDYEQIHISHGIGLEVHEAPDMSAPEMSSSATPNEVLKENMVIELEIGLTIAGRSGVRIENMIQVTGNGNKPLSNFDLELRQL